MKRPVEGLTIRAALVLGFGLTLGLWLLEGYQFARQVEDVRRGTAEVNERYSQAQQLLSTVRAQVILGGVNVRNALLDPDPASTEGYRREIVATYKTIDDELRGYVPAVDPAGERTRTEALRQAIVAYQEAMLDVLSTNRMRWVADARTMLNERILPKLTTVIRLSDEAQTETRNTFMKQQANVATLFGATQGRIWTQLGMALAVGLGIALLATLYAGSLERRLRREKAKDVQNTRDLQRLSAQLISAQEEERRTIARELHDEVGQVLMAIKVELSIAERKAQSAGAPAHLLESAQTITDSAIHTVRDLSHLLHPAMLDDLGLPAAVDWYLRGFSRRYGIRTELVHTGMDRRLDSASEAAAYRIVQEAVTNVAKHARASTCRVHLRRLSSTFVITIDDDGTGFDNVDVQDPNRRGLGLIGIRERASQLRGTFVVDSTPGKGTLVTVELPAHLRAEASDTLWTDSSSAAFAAPGAESRRG